jgi:hypothetical protein
MTTPMEIHMGIHTLTGIVTVDHTTIMVIQILHILTIKMIPSIPTLLMAMHIQMMHIRTPPILTCLNR